MITPILKDIISRRFLLEGATYLGNNKVAFVNVYNSNALDGVDNSRVNEKSVAYHLDLKTKQLKTYEFEKGICASAVAPTLSDNILLVITNIGIFKWDINNNTLSLWHEFNFTKDWPSGTRSNDCRVDPDGNLLVSWMGEGAHRDGLNTNGKRNRQGELWQIRPDHTETKLIDDLYIPNGHIFIPTKQNNVYRVLFNDTARTFKDPTLPRAVDEYLYDSKNSTMKRVGVFYKFEGGDDVHEFPDGMAISADNKLLFVPMFFGGGIDVIDIERKTILKRIIFPNSKQVTSVALSEDIGFVTSASEFYSEEKMSEVGEENCGCIGVFALDFMEKVDNVRVFRFGIY